MRVLLLPPSPWGIWNLSLVHWALNSVKSDKSDKKKLFITSLVVGLLILQVGMNCSLSVFSLLVVQLCIDFHFMQTIAKFNRKWLLTVSCTTLASNEQWCKYSLHCAKMLQVSCDMTGYCASNHFALLTVYCALATFFCAYLSQYCATWCATCCE